MFSWRKVDLAREVTLPSKKGSLRAHHLFFTVIKRQVSVRKCSKCWLAQGRRGRRWGRRVTLLPGVTFLHMRGATLHAVLGGPHGIAKENNMNKQSLEPSSKTKELRSIGDSSKLPARLLGPRSLIGYLRDQIKLKALLPNKVKSYQIKVNLIYNIIY